MSESDSQIRQGILVMLVLVRYVKPELSYVWVTRNGLGQGEERGVVGNVAAGEEKSGLLLVQRCQLLLQVFVHHRVARDVPSSSGPGSVVDNSLPGDHPEQKCRRLVLDRDMNVTKISNSGIWSVV